jgi:DNA-binding CsgD family transcriptional regulator
MIERETAGRREWWVTENAAHMWQSRALGPAEALVLERAARGQTNVEIGYGLGLSEVAVSRALRTASLKPGAAGPTELVRLAAAVLPRPPSPPSRWVSSGCRVSWSTASCSGASTPSTSATTS